MRTIFLDTAGLIALWDTSDQWNPVAAAAYEILQQAPFIAVTSPYVLLECANAASRRPYRPFLSVLRRELAKDNLIIVPEEREIETAWSTYEAGAQGTASVVDLISFAIMRRVGIVEAFTNDRHFKAVGFKTLF